MKKAITYLLLAILCLQGISQESSSTFPFQLNNTEYAWFGVGIASYGVAYLLTEQIDPLNVLAIDGLHATQINSFDRSATQKWNTQLADISHIGKYALAFSPALMMLPSLKNKDWTPFITYGVMYFETALLTTGLTNLTKALSQRIRPYYYNTEFNTNEKQALGEKYGSQDAFFSGHSAIAFSSAVFLSSTYTQIYGSSTWSKIIWASSMAIATSTSYLRYESGQHFPTDLIAGAALGASIGYLVPYFHKKGNNKLGLVIVPNQIYLSYQF